ncbi:MAG: cyanophycinase [Gemmatimonadetes bacterium]|nr:cyanophycinase [Gemmatimonadota bacterium]
MFPRRSIVMVAAGAALLLASPVVGQEIGPANGSLVIVGGAMRDTAIVRRFLDLAGGTDAPIVVIPTAGTADRYGRFWPGLRQFKALGATNLSVLHTRDRAVANSDEFVAPLRAARGVWFSGGRQWRLADTYLDTKVHDELWALLERGGVIGGSSAGATIQGSYLARGDTRSNTIMMGDHEEGMAFLRNVAIDQHLLRRNRQFDLIEIIEAHPELLGIGLDENTAIVVRGDAFEVMGQGYVAIYDHERQLDSGGRFYFLAPGDRFNLKTREASRMELTPRPLGRVEERPWR